MNLVKIIKNMKWWQKPLTLFVLSFLSFAPYLFLKKTLLGFDSYAHAIAACSHSQTPHAKILGAKTSTIMLNGLFKFLPCNFFLQKLFLFFLFFLTILTISLIGKTFYEKNGWLTGLFVFLAPGLVFEFYKFENEPIAIFLLMFSLLFIVKGVGVKPSKYIKKQALYITGIVFIIIAGFFWKGTVFHSLTLSFLSPILFIFNSFLSAMFSTKIIGYLFSNSNGLIENTGWIGLSYLYLLGFGLIGLGEKKYRKTFGLPVLILLGFGLIKAKLMFLVIPFLAIGIPAFFKLIKQKRNKKIHRKVLTILVIASITCSFAWGLSTLYKKPSDTTVNEIKKSVKTNEKILNDWDIGWIIKYYNGKTKSYASIGRQQKPEEFNGSKVIYRKNGYIQKHGFLNKLKNCEKGKEFKRIKILKC